MADSQNNSNQRATIARVDTKIDMVLRNQEELGRRLDKVDTRLDRFDERIRANETGVASLKVQSRVGDGLTAIGAFLAALIGIFVKPQ